MSAASTEPVELTDAQLQAVDALRRHTTYLWKSFAALTGEKKSFTCPIRQATYQKVRKNLNTLCEAGFFEFNLIHEASGGSGSVIQLEISHISDGFKARIQALPPDAPVAETDLPKLQPTRPVKVVRKSSSTRPLTEMTAPRPDSVSLFSRFNPVSSNGRVARLAGRVGGMRLGVIVVGALLVLAGFQRLFHTSTPTTGDTLLAHLEPRTPTEPLKVQFAPPKPAPEPPKPAPEPPKPAPEPPKPAPEPPKPAPEPPKPAPEPPKPAPEPPKPAPEPPKPAPEPPKPAPEPPKPAPEPPKPAPEPPKPAPEPPKPAPEPPKPAPEPPKPAPVEPVATEPVAVTPVSAPAASPPRQLVTPALFARQAIRFPLEHDESPVKPVAAVKPARVVVDVPVLNLHPLPALQGEPIKAVPQGSELQVLWNENGWLRVTDTTEAIGWVLAYGTRDINNRQRLSILDTLSNGSD
ncbi:hypothetical protein SIID45300_03102 [Candidatus Magnetaquicoccaceae bacterium FCR-1]|uniref:SH3b domain-containing protein n=1 Tax=Candidatus Magnetaquiglobus chichijimensis TaxID=3141448 RepID=A0ABQ0CCY2_9PROT